MSTLTVGTIAEKVTDAGVAVDGVTLKDGGGTFTSAVGVTGNTTITSGNLVIGTSGNGIDFSAVSGSASGSSSALLDDYEEGTFDPFTNVADQYSGEVTRTATYRKIGTMVAIDLRVKFTGTDNSSSNFELALPFVSAVASNDATAYVGSIIYEGTQLFSGASILSHNASGTNTVIPYRGDGGTFTSVTRAMVNGTYDFLISFVYFSA